MYKTSLLEDQWPEVVAQLPASLELERSARAFGAIRRCRKVRDAESLLRLALLYGPGGASLRGVAAWTAQSGPCGLSDVAVLKRLRGACDWLEHIAGALLSARLDGGEAGGEARRPLRLTDGTVITGPGGATWRLHASFDPVAGRFEHLELSDAAGAESLLRGPVVPGEIRIADRNYARWGDLGHVVSGGGDFIVRTGWRKVRLRWPDGSDFDLFAALGRLGEGLVDDIDLAVAAPAAGPAGAPDLPVRLIVLRKPRHAADHERGRARRRASKNGQKLDPRTLIAADYMLLLTSLPRDACDAARIAALYRLRWQVELAFKRLKSIVHIDRLPARDPRLARSWIAAHLIIALITQDIGQEFLDSPP